MEENNNKLSLKLRIIIGILGLPSLLLAFMLGATAINGDYSGISFFEVIYSLVGIFAIYIALTGKKFF